MPLKKVVVGVLEALCHPSSPLVLTSTAVLKEGSPLSGGESVIWPSGKALGW